MTVHDSWTIDADSATHESGLRLVFSGTPGTDNFEVRPERLPDSLSSREQIRLLREGVEAYQSTMSGAAHATSHSTEKSVPSGKTSGVDVQVKRRRPRPESGRH